MTRSQGERALRRGYTIWHDTSLRPLKMAGRACWANLIRLYYPRSTRSWAAIYCTAGWMKTVEASPSGATATQVKRRKRWLFISRPEYTLDDLRHALAGEITVPAIDSDAPPILAIGADALPPDIQQLAQEKDLNPDKANKLFEKISGSLFNRLPGRDDPAESADLEQARALVSGSGQDIWNSRAGQRIRATAGLLVLPGNWRLPHLGQPSARHTRFTGCASAARACP